MKTSHSILVELTANQATASAIAARLHLPERVIAAFLDDLLKDGLVEFSLVKNTLPLWLITAAGRALASSLTRPCNA